jgi:hypothetical protein
MHRAHTLPFRIEHPQPPPPPLSAFELTEADSPPTGPSSVNSPASFMSLPGPPEIETADADINMDEEVSIVGSNSPPSPYQQQTWLRPAKLNSPNVHENFSGGRIPTPIHSNFVIGVPPRTAIAQSNNMLQDEEAWSSRLTPIRQRPHLMENDHRMPSPISEDYIDATTDITSSQLSRLSFNGEDNMEMDIPAHSDAVVPDTPTRTGRARSGAITAGGGQEKKRFVVGYRDDCDKCRAKVAGHWAHFLPI